MALAFLAATLFGASCAASPLSHIGTGSRGAAAFSIRPVLCFAAPYTPPPAGTVLPRCGEHYQSAADSVGPLGPSDPDFSHIPSTATRADVASATVLLPASPTGSLPAGRYVLGPTTLTSSSISSAKAVRAAGLWTVPLTFTPSGSARFRQMTEVQFHKYMSVVFEGQVILAADVEPGLASFAPLTIDDRWVLAGNLSEEQAKALAGEL